MYILRARACLNQKKMHMLAARILAQQINSFPSVGRKLGVNTGCNACYWRTDDVSLSVVSHPMVSQSPHSFKKLETEQIYSWRLCPPKHRRWSAGWVKLQIGNATSPAMQEGILSNEQAEGILPFIVCYLIFAKRLLDKSRLWVWWTLVPHSPSHCCSKTWSFSDALCHLAERQPPPLRGRRSCTDDGRTGTA